MVAISSGLRVKIGQTLGPMVMRSVTAAAAAQAVTPSREKLCSAYHTESYPSSSTRLVSRTVSGRGVFCKRPMPVLIMFSPWFLSVDVGAEDDFL